MRLRIGAFRGRFMKKFAEEHKRAFPEKTRAPEFGYPDSGCGYYAKRLPYADWFRMNNGQRCQINFLEHITYAIIAPLIIGLQYPAEALYISIAIFVGRLLFTLGYSSLGPSARLPGALIMDAGLFIGFGYIVATVISFGK